MVALPLAGVRVLAIETFIAAPVASMLMADWGADVVKVEPPAGDPYRGFPPVVQNDDKESMSVSFSRLNRGKRSVVLRLDDPEGVAEFRRLAATADVVLENLRPGVLSKLGLDYAALSQINPRLILVSISGFGQADVLPGPLTGLPALDLVGQAMSGLCWVNPDDRGRPRPVGFPLIDTATGDWAVMGVLLALRQREATGFGQHVDVAMYDVGIHLNEYKLGTYAWSRTDARRGRLTTSAPFDVFAAGDGYFAVAVAGDAIFERFCDAIDRLDLLDDPRMRDGTARAEIVETVLRPLIEGWAESRTVAEVLTVFRGRGVPSAPVQSVEDVLSCPHAEARQMIAETADPLLGPVLSAGNPLKSSAFSPRAPRPAPQLGAHAAEVARDWLDRQKGDL